MSEDLVAHVSGESADSGPPCFWSYAHEDDFRIGGKLSEVTEDFRNYYKFETGKELPFFKDVESIAWGQRWEDRVSHGLQNVLFLIPAITPNFLRSQACRSEILQFDAVCRARGVKNLILPIVFSGRHLIVDENEDEVAQLITKTQYVPFDEVWFTDRTGELWMRTVRNMVLSLISIESAAEEELSRALAAQATESTSDTFPPSRPPTTEDRTREPINIASLDEEGDDQDPQIAELVSSLEDSIERATALLVEMFQKFEEVAIHIGSWGDGSSNLKNAKEVNQYFFRVARDLDEPARAFHRSAAEAYNATLEADTVVRMIRQLTGEMNEQSLQQRFNDEIATAFRDTSGMTALVDEINGMLPQIADVERYSALLKKAVRPVRGGMQIARDTTDIMLSWKGDSTTSLPPNS